MRKIGITLWVVAGILAAGLSAVLLRTDLLAEPQTPSTAPQPAGRAGTPATTTRPPPTAPITVPPSATSVPATSPNDAAAPNAPANDGPGTDTTPADGPPADGTGVNDLYQAFQNALQQLMGGETDRPGVRSFYSWYQHLSTGYGQAVPLDEAFAWYQQLLGGRSHGNGRLDGAGGPDCSGGHLWRSTCPEVTGSDS
jgi:hypothetical protein